MTEKLKEALQKLDVGNDNHWTAEGLARLDTVKFLSGGESVTREELEAQFAGFNRTTAPAYWMSAEVASEEKPTEEAPVEPTEPATATETAGAESAESPREDGAGAPPQASQPSDQLSGELVNDNASETEQPTLENIGDDVPDEIETLEAELEEVEEEIGYITQRKDDLKKELVELNKKADDLRAKLNEVKPPETLMSTIQTYLASTKKQLEQRGENRQALKASGLSLKGIAQAIQPAPIDAAFARKNARGGRRPSRV